LLIINLSRLYIIQKLTYTQEPNNNYK